MRIQVATLDGLTLILDAIARADAPPVEFRTHWSHVIMRNSLSPATGV